ncbi:hypothetical protein [Streptomyces sp. PsTaAH-124]|uniref:hypothetical protein n=1 Tax=Streptomyces sp. PsTaAH-124 TaxID=1157638 RepID=UPI00037A4A7E|nr:hypothetical protein [Streptomyces sp. PsTaAH-124]
MIEPGRIPQYTGDFAKLSKAVSQLRTRAVGIRNDGQDVHSRFQATAAYYKAPEADQLLSTTRPVMDTADEFAAHIESLADALETFAAEAKPHADRLKELREKASTFVDSVRGDDDWTKDQDKIDAHDALMDGVAEAVDGFQTAERDAANKISRISPGACRPSWVVDDGSHAPGMYGVHADTLTSMGDLPWGSPESRSYERWSLDWWGHGAKSWAWDGIVKDSVWGGFVGLGVLEDNLLGVNGAQARSDTWDGLRRTVVGTYAYGMDAVGLGGRLSDWQRDSEAYADEFGKGFVAYDTWDEDPARAHAVTTFSLLTLFGGAAGGLARVSRAGRVAETAGALARAGDVLDPVSGGMRAAKALSDLPKVSETLTRVSDHLKLPKPHLSDTALDLNDRYRITKDGNLVPLHADGTPDMALPEREPAATDRAATPQPSDHQLLTAGARRGGSTAMHAGDAPPSSPAQHSAGPHGSEAVRRTHEGTHAGPPHDGGSEPHDGGHRAGGDHSASSHSDSDRGEVPRGTDGNDPFSDGTPHQETVPSGLDHGPADHASNRERPPREGDTNYIVDNPENWADTITDIDRIDGGILWEEKTATGRDPRVNVNKWIAKHVFKKLDSYVRARHCMSGYEGAPLGLDFTEPGATSEFRAAVESGVAEWVTRNPGVDVRVRWAE